MVIKKYVAKTMREALADIKSELGDGAVILKTRKVTAGAFPFSGGDIEVTAGLDEQTKPAPAVPAVATAIANAMPGVYTRPRSSCIVAEGEAVTVRPWLPPGIKTNRRAVVNAGIAASDQQPYAELKEEVRQLTDLVRTAVSKPAPSPLPVTSSAPAGIWDGFRNRLIESEVSADLASLLINEAARSTDNPDKAEAVLSRIMQNRFPASGPIRCKNDGPRVVAFVGPAGAGKTTTIAKLAARCRMGNQRKVSLITIDTYRVAAIEQIKSFAAIMKAGLQVVYSPGEVQAALAACAGDDLVFIDTAGRSRRNSVHMEELRQFLEKIRPAETHLVLSATTKDSDLRETIADFGPVGINRLLFTKLDETSRLGNIFSAVAAGPMPVSFLGSGQNVPDDIELAQSSRFIERLWRNPAHG